MCISGSGSGLQLILNAENYEYMIGPHSESGVKVGKDNGVCDSITINVISVTLRWLLVVDRTDILLFSLKCHIAGNLSSSFFKYVLLAGPLVIIT